MTREEAIETIKKNTPSEKSLPVLIVQTYDFYEALETLIPELCENEDERVRKEMIEFLSQYKENGLRGIDITPWIAYLEKQKEQKPFNVCEQCPYYKDCPDYNEKKQEWSEEDEKIAKEIEEELWYPGDFPDYPSKEESELHDSCQRRLDWFKNKLKSLRLQPKSNEEEIKKIRSEEYTKGFNDAAFGGKIKEWSEEDESQLDDIEKAISNYYDLNHAPQYHYWLEQKLKSLRPPLKDKEMKLKILKYLSTRCSSLEFEEVEDYLNNLRPYWKPSEEQMEALKRASINEYLSAKQFDILVSLYEQLKKL